MKQVKKTINCHQKSIRIIGTVRQDSNALIIYLVSGELNILITICWHHLP